MSKPRLLITVNGGIIQHIAANQEVEVVIIDHDNLRDETEQALKELGEIQNPDCIMSKWDMQTSIKLLKQSYSNDLDKNKIIIGYQVVNDENDIHPNMAASFCIYSKEQAKEMIKNSIVPEVWKLLPIYSGDIEKPTFMFE